MEKDKVQKIKSEIEKFVVSREDDLLDIVGKITTSDAQKIILTFTEPTDILISPINIKVLLETADENGKAVIAQIVQNPVGVRNAKEAGMTTTEATGTILDEYWLDSEKGLKRRTKIKDEKLHQSNMRYKSVSAQEIVTKEEEIEPEMNSMEMDVPQEKSDFQRKIEEAMERSRNNLEKGEGKVVDEGGIKFALDQDIVDANKQTYKNNKGNQQPSLIGRDIAFLKSLPEEEIGVTSETGADGPKPKTVRNLPSGGSAIVNFVRGIGEKISSTPLKKIGLRILVPILALLVVAGWLVYELVPLVKATIFIESKAVSVEKVFNGDIKANEFNYENGIVPIKKEEAGKSVSATVTPSGKAFRGNKAEGVVTLKYWGAVSDLPITVNSGTILTANTGETFELVNNVTVGDDGSFLKPNVAVRATQVGEEYNLPSGKTFSVKGYNQSTELSGENSTAFAGGSKESYTVLSQGDVDKIVKELKPTTIKEVNEELEGKTDNGWEIIASTLKSDIEGAPKTDVPVGAEADVANVTIEVKGSAMYFKKGELEEKMNEVLTKSAQDQNLFENSGDIKLELDENIQKEITVEEVKGDTVKIKVVAKGEVKPKIDKNEIVKKLQGKSWKEGEKILKEMKYTDKKTEYSFSPSYFPEWLKYFPQRQGRIILTVKEIFK
ncbi:hypothetical protein HYV12_04585 [Candidatus Dojkabacteria bacterium]|nr:hypothetical protein [Candidatus Dojkabacteria bacterium]